MGVFEKYMVIIIYAISTITLVTCDDDDNTQFYNELLKLFNFARTLHGAQPLILDLELCEEATEYVNNVYYATVDIFKNINYYNILVLKSTKRMTAKRMFKYIYSGGNDYNYDYEDKYGYYASFTSMLWKETTNVGFGLLYKDQSNYLSVIYSPIPQKEERCVQNVGEPRDIAIFKSFSDFIHN